MKTSIGQGTDRSPSFIRTVPSAGEEATTAPISATTAGDTPLQRFGAPQRHHRAEQQQHRRCSGGESGPDTGGGGVLLHRADGDPDGPPAGPPCGWW
ncbi:hypothetical protein Shyd_59860 [Streptomyces hydrogenans]|uniref:Uncharacterized protein n=1 Tax=Streptomyces hydrogenans TaxID=1873719 RepID=A0ABQ3PHV8_9ACTN|nr:hypothetical protein Shyd_59860 [Streptomyces hydrogenans]